MWPLTSAMGDKTQLAALPSCTRLSVHGPQRVLGSWNGAGIREAPGKEFGEKSGDLGLIPDGIRSPPRGLKGLRTPILEPSLHLNCPPPPPLPSRMC